MRRAFQEGIRALSLWLRKRLSGSGQNVKGLIAPGCLCATVYASDLRKTLLGHLSYAVSSPRDFYPMWLSLLSCRMKVRDIKKCKTNTEFFDFLNLFTCKAQFGKDVTLEKANQTATI